MAGGIYGDRMQWTPERIKALNILIAEGLSNSAAAKVLGVSRSTVAGARFRFSIKTEEDKRSSLRPIPDDFAELGPRLTVSEARVHYKATGRTIKRWHDEQGTKHRTSCFNPHKPESEKRKNQPKVERSYRAPRRTGGNSPARKFQIPLRPSTIAGSAQLFLQRFGPCFRAKIVDPKAANDEWLFQGRRLSESEMLSIAARKGFEVAA